MADAIRAGVIGAGFQGRLHVEHLRGVEGVEVVAICDVDERRATDVAETFGVPHVENDHRRLLDEHDLDLVTICTMPVLHREMTIDAFATGVHVLCEKPLAMDAVEGRAMLDAADDAGRLLAVGFNLRHTRSAQILKRFVDGGRFGSPVYTRTWAKASQIPWWGQHYRRDVSGGGALASTAVHLLDLAIWLAGSPTPTTASATMGRLFPTKRGSTAPPGSAEQYDTEDLISAHVRFAEGCWMTVEGSWIDNVPSVDGTPSWDYSLDAVGGLAQLQFDPLAITVEDEAGNVVSALGPDDVPGVSFPESTGVLIADVVDAIRTGRQPLVRAEEALVVQAVSDAMYRSAELGREVEVVVPPSRSNA